ncbi:MAG: pyruvate ferredoxin oxidoreductase [Dehalococcoidia bacterium]|jgi:pyruvate ferredoxin oxidoreductase alpha subunit|nr:pyruvate ferredoxin oxidoreductase [Dehalococcoidia bacterium]MDP7470041.1 pyruvate ferredoxin oxidoreductase [Dehalococcoidia bacterium]
MARRIIEGSRAVAEAVALCKPQVVAAYPITPQTHIVHELAQLVADGNLKLEFVNVESEHSAASVVLGASATGVRVFTSSSSQGLVLMAEVLFNIAGMRLPVVLACVNRAVSAPLSIWTDHQDSMVVRDAGILQFYSENAQEAADLTYLAYRVAEDHRVLLPAMVCLDGYVISHAWEVVDMPEADQVDAYLPPFQPRYRLDPTHPVSMGMYAEPDKYLEARYMVQRAMERSIGIIQDASNDFERVFGRPCPGLMEEYRMEDADTVMVAMGSMASTAKMVVDQHRESGEKLGLLKLITYRPFPEKLLYQALEPASRVVVLDKAVSLGAQGPLGTEVRSMFLGQPRPRSVSTFILGLGGRDVTESVIDDALRKARRGQQTGEFLDLRSDLDLEEV